MKKKTIALLLTITLAVSMFGCGKSNSDKEQLPTETGIVVNTEPPVEPVSEIPTETEIPFDSTGYTQFSNVYYILSADWEYYQETNGTLVYRLPDGTESFAIFVQNESDYSAEQMQAAYSTTVTTTYGDRCTQEDVTIGSYPWHVYHYTGDNDLNTSVAVDVYVYSDGATTIYIENCYPASTIVSGKIQELLASIVIQ